MLDVYDSNNESRNLEKLRRNVERISAKGKFYEGRLTTLINFGTHPVLGTWKIVKRESDNERGKKTCKCEMRSVTFKNSGVSCFWEMEILRGRNAFLISEPESEENKKSLGGGKDCVTALYAVDAGSNATDKGGNLCPFHSIKIPPSMVS